jgi:D-alanyl-D-alanine dipeptidase
MFKRQYLFIILIIAFILFFNGFLDPVKAADVPILDCQECSRTCKDANNKDMKCDNVSVICCPGNTSAVAPIQTHCEKRLIIKSEICYPQNGSCAHCAAHENDAQCKFFDTVDTCGSFGLDTPCCLNYYSDNTSSGPCTTGKTQTPTCKTYGTVVSPTKKPIIQFFPQINLPGFKGGEVTGTTFGNYISAFYVYFTGIVGILATVMIIAGGLQWITAAGNQTKITQARSTIEGALIGLVLTLCAFLLLNTINPSLVRWRSLVIPSPEAIRQEWDKPETTSAVCKRELPEDQTQHCGEAENLVTDIKTKVNEDNPGLNDWIVIDSKAVRDPRLLKSTIDILKSAAQEGKGGIKIQKKDGTWDEVRLKIKIKDAFRTWSTQNFLYCCYEVRVANDNICPAECTGGCNEAAEANCTTCSHCLGTAIDACYCIVKTGWPDDCNTACTGTINTGGNGTIRHAGYDKTDSDPYPGGTIQKAFQRMMQAGGFSRYYKEWWHFQTGPINAPGCPGEYKSSQTSCPAPNV